MHQLRLPAILSLLTAAPVSAAEHVIVVSEAAAADPAWSKVVAALRERRQSAVVTWKAQPEEALPALTAQHPRFTCFIAPPTEVSDRFVNRVHRLTRKLDADPWTDTRWGILTGFDADDALKAAMEPDPLTIRRVGSGTEVALDRVAEGTWYCELRQKHMVVKAPGGKAAPATAPPDTTKALVDLMNDGRPDLWVTSGHATERDWMLGFRYRNGFWKSKGGALYGEDTAGARFDVRSPNPKVYLAVGNCLMGHIDGPDAMALAWMHSAGVRQMAGYVKPTWYGYMGWGLLDYFVEQPGRHSLSEAFLANNLALVHRLRMACPEALEVEEPDDMGRPPRGTPPLKLSPAGKAAGLSAMDINGLLFDRDMVAFYGDPAWEARVAEGPCQFRQKLEVSGEECTLTIEPLAGDDSWKPVNTNGSQRGGRPIVAFLPRRIDPATVQVTEGAERSPVIADDFVLVPLPAPDAPATGFRIRFKAAPLP